MDTFDLAVIGGGTAGLVTAAGAAFLGAEIALIERDRLGGREGPDPSWSARPWKG